MEVILGELEGSPTPSTLGDLDTSQGTSVPKTSMKWTPWMNEVLLTTLLHQCHLGKRADSGFKKEAWTAVTVAVAEVYYGTAAVTDKQVKSKADWWKLMWKECLVSIHMCKEGRADSPNRIFFLPAQAGGGGRDRKGCQMLPLRNNEPVITNAVDVIQAHCT
jgi:hypothetical protein